MAHGNRRFLVPAYSPTPTLPRLLFHTQQRLVPVCSHSLQAVSSVCRTIASKSLVPRRKSEIPRLFCPSTIIIVPQDIVVRDNVAVSIEPPGTRLEAVACEVKSMSLARLFDIHAEVAYNPAGHYLHKRQESPFQESDLFYGWQVFLRTRRVGVDEARSCVQEHNLCLWGLC